MYLMRLFRSDPEGAADEKNIMDHVAALVREQERASAQEMAGSGSGAGTGSGSGTGAGENGDGDKVKDDDETSQKPPCEVSTTGKAGNFITRSGSIGIDTDAGRTPSTSHSHQQRFSWYDHYESYTHARQVPGLAQVQKASMPVSTVKLDRTNGSSGMGMGMENGYENSRESNVLRRVLSAIDRMKTEREPQGRKQGPTVTQADDGADSDACSVETMVQASVVGSGSGSDNSLDPTAGVLEPTCTSSSELQDLRDEIEAMMVPPMLAIKRSVSAPLNGF